MIRNESSILDFGSGKITVLVGERGVNRSINLLGTGEAHYGGFADGEWLEPEKLADAVSYAINNAETNSRTKIGRLFVGVPGEFTVAVAEDANLNFTKKRRVLPSDVRELFDIGREKYEDRPDYEVINQGAVWFQTDDNRRVAAPEGLLTAKLSARLSYTLCEYRFVEFVKKILADAGITDIEFVSAPLAEALYLFPPETRDQSVVLLDIGYISSTLAFAQGDGVVNMKSFSVGGGHITGDLSQVLNIRFNDAENLKRKVILSLDVSEDDKYEIVIGEEVKAFPAKQINEIVEARVQYIADLAAKCLNAEDNNGFPKYAPVQLTGGGLAYLKGGKELLAKHMNRGVELAVPKQAMLNRPYMSAALGVLDMAINETGEPVKQSLLVKLLNKIKKK
ncbi:cell division protein FtsA [Clostridia bacterium]|nr:cell division protein FtsA [Clostridia bacterium]